MEGSHITIVGTLIKDYMLSIFKKNAKNPRGWGTCFWPTIEIYRYLVYQLKDLTVSATDLDNPDKARLIYRSDIKDGVSEIVNHYKDPSLAQELGGVWIPVEEISGALSDGVTGSVDEGITHADQSRRN